MILQALVEHYESLLEKGEVEKRGWCKAKVSYALVLNEEGNLQGVIILKTEEERGKKKISVPRSVSVPEQVLRSSGVSSNFLCDNSGYFLGIDKKGKPKRSLECFQCAKEKHLKILNGVQSAPAKAVRAFFEKWDPNNAAEHPVLKNSLEEVMDGGNLLFYFEGKYVQEDQDIQMAWKTWYDQNMDKKEAICMVTGKRDIIPKIHTTIKGVKGAQTSGAALVSFNAKAFESYGKEQNLNASVGNYAAFAYTTALNHLLSDRSHVYHIGDMTIVFWAKSSEIQYQDFFSTAIKPKSDSKQILDGVFKNLSSGKAVFVEQVEKEISMTQPFYILGLAPNAARLSVQLFCRDDFGNILKHLKAHYDRMSIVKPSFDTVEYIGVEKMLEETVNQKSKDKKPVSNMAAAVLRSILEDRPYPQSLYYVLQGRIRAEQGEIKRGRAAIIKAYLLKNGVTQEAKEAATVYLNENNVSVAYLLGRIFAVLEKIQKDANPDINATIKDRYFNSACATPASIFPILFKLKNSHIKKLQQTSPGGAVVHEKRIGDILDKISVRDEQEIAFPRRLSLEEQGMFELGYYHQMQKLYEKKEQKEEKIQEEN